MRRETARRTEVRLLAQRFELAQSSYEALRRQNEQVMMLRHDMVKHFRVLRQTVTDEKAAAYLDELIGENEKIRPVVQSGNEMLDVILNSKLSAAADAGIAVELARTQAWVGDVMDELDPFPGAYTLEVSSPGIDRPLRTAEHFARFAGEQAAVKTAAPVEGRSSWTGELAGMEGGKPAYFGQSDDVVENVSAEKMAVNADFVMELLKSI